MLAVDSLNPHTKCIRAIIRSLFCNGNDLQFIDAETRKVHDQFQEEMKRIKFGSTKANNATGCEIEKVASCSPYTTSRVNTVNELNECFQQKIAELENKRAEILKNLRQCILNLNAEKRKFRQFFERLTDNLKLQAIKSADPAISRKCERDICEMYGLFIKEISLIKNCEKELQSIFQLCGPEDQVDCCFKDYDWLPQGKSLGIENTFNAIKHPIGSTLVRALASFHVQQASDLKSFLANYLMNLEHNENILAEKLNMFGKC